MNVVVSNNKIDYEGFIKVSTLKDVIDIVGTIDFLIYHKSSETSEEKVDYLSILKDKVKTMIYIRKKEYVENAIQIIVVGSNGKYLDDEFFLENSTELSNLVNSFEEVTTLAELGGANVLSDFFNRYLKEGSSGFNTQYLKVVKEAVSEMLAEYKQKELELYQLSETATEVFAHSSNIVSKMEKEQERMRELIDSVKATAKEEKPIQTTNIGSIPSIMFFPQISYLKERNIVRIKEVGYGMYLTSFVLAFRAYLEKVKNVRPKLIVALPLGSQYETEFKDFKWVTQQTIKNMSNYYNNIVFTNCPSKEVITKLIEDTDYDTFIVVDRLKTDSKHILNSKGVPVKYVVSGENSISKFKLQKNNCFSSLKDIKGTMFTIPIFEEYPVINDQREQMYFRSCGKYFDTLYNNGRR